MLSGQPLAQKVTEIQLQRERSQENLIAVLTIASETAADTSYVI